MADKIVVRFAPSPSGYLHIGGARTAIFNWLFARQNNGTFILRIEDTDAERSSEASIQGIIDGLQWLNLNWDQGPYFQSRFVDRHLAAARQMVATGQAYPCFCSKAELDRKRQAARNAKATYRYDGTCRALPPDEAAAKQAAGVARTIRLKIPRGGGAVQFEDRVCGRVVKRHADLEDFVIVRSNGKPLYVLSNAVDDIRDQVTHVIRGQDGLANTPKQILIYQALGAPLPVFAHMSLTLDPQKAKISKRRHGEQVAIHYYRQHGFLPWAMVNFLVLLGWATSDNREIFTPAELTAVFSLNGISRANSVFNLKQDDPKHFTDPKLLKINAHYIRSMSLDELLPLVAAQLKTAGLWRDAFDAQQRDWALQVINLIRGRYQVLTDFVTFGRAYFSEKFAVDPEAVAKHLTPYSALSEYLPALADELETLAAYDASSLEQTLRQAAKKWELKLGQLVNAMRTVLTGQAVGPEFLEMLIVLGQKRVVARLRNYS